MQNETTQQDKVRLELTEAQREQVKQHTGKEAEALELGVEELEARIAPRSWCVAA